MALRIWLAGMVLCLSPALLTGCSSTDAAPGAAESGLDTTEVTIRSGGRTHRFAVEIARSSAEQQQGLMGRTELAPGAGMLFPFNPPKIASFWMKNTLIPLDILFIRSDGSLDRIAENTIPESLEPVASGGEVAAVLELAGGTTAELGIDESARVTWPEQAR